MGITIDTIEDYLYLFQDRNTDFGLNVWAEPIYAAMIRAYQNDEQLTVNIGNEYIRAMITTAYCENKTYSPIEHVSGRSGTDALSEHLTAIMLKNFGSLTETDQRDLKDYLRYLFVELMNNVADHAYSCVGGYTMAQYFGSGRKIQFVIADRGVGFLENMQLNYAVDTEEMAIIKAFEKGITSTRQKMYGAEKNAGFGLFAMLEILSMTGGRFVVISNNALVRFTGRQYESKNLANPWKGVVVAFEFQEANINYNMDHFRRNYLWNSDALGDDEDFF